MPKWPPSSRARWSSSRRADLRPGRLPAAALIGLVRAYRTFLAPALPAACRFAPSCSAFAIEAVERHGATQGLRLTIRRLGRCHPWHPGGYDPVPAPRS